MATVNPSSLIGVQAYSAQLRRQFSQDEASRIGTSTANPARPAARERPAAVLNHLASRKDATANPSPGSGTPVDNPAARPLFSTAQREAPNPNARLRITPPGSHLNIVI